MTPEFRVSWPDVFVAKAVNVGDEPKYSITMIFQKETDITPLKQLVAGVLIEKFGPDRAKWPPKLRLPFRKGEEKDTDGFGPNTIFCRASSKMKPGLVDHNVQPIIQAGEFYGGCYAKATINAFYYDKRGNVGVSFGLQNIQKTRDGEHLSGRNKPEDDFDAITPPEGQEQAGGTPVDPLAGIGA